MPWLLLVVVAVVGGGVGAVWGFVRGLDYLPTLPVAIIEGGFLFGVPAIVLGLVLTGLWASGTALRRHGR
jgi:hypothetical protein